MMSNNQIIYISTDRIYPNPDNPRKDLGDLTELTESIRTSGILQNLTIVPDDIDGYRKMKASKRAYTDIYNAVIGHRRLAAAKLAGLTEVPCVIKEIDRTEQIAIMLTENMQRNALTAIEEADSFQLMLDLGETITSISEKTGCSDSTVRRRVKLKELDREKLEAAADRGGTLQDYAELDKIKDIKLRNAVLEKIGTPNFNWELNAAIKKEKCAENKTKYIEIFDTFAEPVDLGVGLNYLKYISFENEPDIEIPEDAGERRYFYQVHDTCIQLYTEYSKPSTPADSTADERRQKEQALQERRSKLAELSKAAYMLRVEVVKNYSGNKKHAQIIMEFMARTIFDSPYNFDDDLFFTLLDIERDEEANDEPTFDSVAEMFEKSPEYVSFVTAYCNSDDSERRNYYSYSSLTYEGNEALDTIYSTLEQLGYKLSDEEHALRDGTHELYTKPEE